MTRQVDLVQLTPRRSFDVAKAFDETGQLNVVCTDFALASEYVAKKILPSRVSAERYVLRLKSGRVKCRRSIGLRYKIRLNSIEDSKKHLLHLWAADELASYYLSVRDRGPRTANVVYCVDTAARKCFENSGDKLKVLEQCVAPRVTQFEALAKYGSKEELQYWGKHYESLARTEQAEWSLADAILSPSQFVTDELVRLGVPKSKVVKLPYWTPFSPLAVLPERDTQEIKVLFVGNDACRKGLRDLFVVANRLREVTNMTFEIVGSVVNEFRRLQLEFPEARVTYAGILSHSHLSEKLRASHVFFLPSYIEGSSVATYEAMSFGLAVVTTSEAGAVVSNGKSGYEFQAGDLDGFERALRRLSVDAEHRAFLSANALAAIKKFQFEDYSQSLRGIVDAL
ncbi:Glycosyl transferase, group 1 [Rhodopirellula islandica]|uniref:Glycosyl transferase, group 1 n=1 Tax=Rhodopirellula islandica TaxID=595434 RepID=A0A0J1B3D8_RHOIS|nr:glycosyltransferase family 4 protein [Rhodopirellula islandica]KLU01292.1 Glycosyl transferase, group 1 [Rhodopirellula islandica]